MDKTTMLVYKDGSMLHFAGPNPGTPYTLCGLDAGLFPSEERPVTWAGMWCTNCLNGRKGEVCSQST